MEYGEYIANFKNPPGEYRGATMWFLNDELKKEELSFQLEQFKEQGVYDIFVNAVWGLDVKYLSDEFFGFVRYIVDECKRLGLRYWIYDEFNWPSGNAGGELLRDYPWAKGKILKLESALCLPGHPAQMLVRGELLLAHAVFGQGGDCIVEDITDRVKTEESNGVTSVFYSNGYCNTVTVNCYFSIPDPHVLTTCVWYRHAGYEQGYIDTFNKAAAEKFIELTHERYKKWVGDEFGKTVMGVFTDEVCLSDPFTLGENRLPWSDVFAEKFFELNGYDIVSQLHGLITPPATPGQKKVREDYFNTAKILYLENFIKPMYDWCEENNLKFTGHFDGEESVTWHLMQSADLMTSLEFMHMPGIDSIVSAKKINDKNFNVAGKLLASAAKYYNRERTLCETYTASGWDLRMPMMKKIANRLIMLGVNMIHYMGAYYSWDGFMKTGYTSYPPTHSYNNTLWGHYGKFGDYVAGMQYLSAKTKPSCAVLLMIPLVQAKMKLDLSQNIFDYLKDDFCLRPIDAIIEGAIDVCLKAHIDIDLVSEDAADELEAKGGMIGYRGGRYGYIILPAMEHISPQVRDMIKKLEAAGANILYIEPLPANIVGDEGQAPAYSGKSTILSGTDAIKSAVDAKYVMLGMQNTGNVLACRRENEDIELFFIDNDDDSPNTVSIPGDVPGLVCYDPETKAPKEYHTENGRRIYELAPDEMMVGIKNKNDNTQSPEIPQKAKRLLSKQTLAEGWRFDPVSENVLPLKYFFADYRKFKHVPLDSCAFPSGYPAHPGMKYKLLARFVICGLGKIPAIHFNCEVRDVEKIVINGHEINFSVNTRFWGVNNFQSDISDILCEGENALMIEAKLPDWVAWHALPFAFLSGRFKVNENNAIVPVLDERINTGSIAPQGYKYFTGKGVFKNTFVPPETYASAFVNFDNRDIMKLSVNGVYVCERMWKPYRADITDYIRRGERSEIALEMTTTYANMFGLDTENGLGSVDIEFYA